MPARATRSTTRGAMWMRWTVSQKTTAGRSSRAMRCGFIRGWPANSRPANAPSCALEVLRIDHELEVGQRVWRMPDSPDRSRYFLYNPNTCSHGRPRALRLDLAGPVAAARDARPHPRRTAEALVGWRQ